MSWDTIRAAIESLVYRGKVVSAVVRGRTVMQVSGLYNDTYNNIELLLPPGYVAVPVSGSDIVLMQVGAFGSHKFAIAGDHTADAVANLQPGEGGLARGGQLILQRIGKTNVVAPVLAWGLTEQALNRLVHEKFMALFNTHTHGEGLSGETDVPTQKMNATHLTGGS